MSCPSARQQTRQALLLFNPPWCWTTLCNFSKRSSSGCVNGIFIILSRSSERRVAAPCHSRWSWNASRNVMIYSTSSVLSPEIGNRECDAHIIISQSSSIVISSSANSTLTRGVITDSAVMSESQRRFLICFFSSSSTAQPSWDISINASTSSVVILLWRPLAPNIRAIPLTKRLRRNEIR